MTDGFVLRSIFECRFEEARATPEGQKPLVITQNDGCEVYFDMLHDGFLATILA